MSVIFREDAIEAITNYAKFLWNNFHEKCNSAGMIDAIEALPTIDAEEVVRCKDCKFCENTRFFNTSAKICRWWEKLTDEDGFCHAAKLKGEEDDSDKD